MLNADDMRDVFELAMDRGIDWIDEMTARFAPDGVSYWDEQFKTDADFVAWVIDQQSFPSPDNNVFMHLRYVSPQLLAEIETRYRKAAPKVLGLRV